MRRLSWCLALVVAAPFAFAACGDAAPPPKTPTKPVPAGYNPTPNQPQIGMSDASSARPGDAPDGAPRPAMNAAAAGVYMQGLQYFANGDLVNAKAAFTKATQEDPRAHQAFYSLGVCQERLRDPGASASYRQAYTLVPDYEPAIISYAMLQAKKNNLGDAERFLTEKRGQMPKSAAIAATLAEIKSLQKDTGSAQRIAQEALKINPDYRPAMVTIARDHYRNRRLDLALYALTAILDGFEPVDENPPRDKDNPEAFLLRGLIWREQGLRAQAMDQFRKAVTRRPDMVEARVQLATFLLEAGNAEEALPMLEGALRFDNDNVAAHLNLGDAYRLMGRFADAKKEFDWVIARDANLAQVHYDLGLMYLFAFGPQNSPLVPGNTAKQQVQAATRELKKFQELRKRGENDDSDELLQRAKLTEAEIDAASQANQPAPPPAPAGGDAGAAAPGADAGPPKADAGAPKDAGGGG